MQKFVCQKLLASLCWIRTGVTTGNDLENECSTSELASPGSPTDFFSSKKSVQMKSAYVHFVFLSRGYPKCTKLSIIKSLKEFAIVLFLDCWEK